MRTRRAPPAQSHYRADVFTTLALFAAISWGASDFVAGLISRTLRPVVVVAWSQAVGCLAMCVVVAVQGLPETGFSGWAPWAVLAGIAGSLGLLCFYAALASGTMGVVAPIAALGGGIPVALGVASGETPSSLAWVGIAVALIGVVLASGPELQLGVGTRSVALAALAAVGFGVALFCLDRGSRVSVVHTMWGMRVTSVLGYAVLALAVRSLGGVGVRRWPVLALVGLGDLLANLLFAVASSSGLVSVAAVLGSLYPVVTILLARKVLGERLRPIQQFGVGVALLGIVALAAAHS